MSSERALFCAQCKYRTYQNEAQYEGIVYYPNLLLSELLLSDLILAQCKIGKEFSNASPLVVSRVIRVLALLGESLYSRTSDKLRKRSLFRSSLPFPKRLSVVISVNHPGQVATS
jgi:hypothetical protein